MKVIALPQLDGSKEAAQVRAAALGHRHLAREFQDRKRTRDELVEELRVLADLFEDGAA